MAEYTNVKVSIEDRVAVLTIDHPPANAFNQATLTELEAAFDELLANDQVKVIVITGAGQFAFVAGADIKEMPELLGNAGRGHVSSSSRARACQQDRVLAPSR